MYHVDLYRHENEYDYEVRPISATSDKYRVNLLRKERDCRKWLLTNLPCFHDICYMRNQDLNTYDYVLEYYKKGQYATCYNSGIYPANGQCL